MKSLKYLTVLTLPVTVFISFYSHGILTFLPVIYSFLIIPFLELFFRPDARNLSEEEEEIRNKDRVYDFMLYLIVPIQYGFLILFFYNINESGLSAFDLAGRISSLGLLCGVFGINVAHELGHRTKPFERFLAKSLLLTSLYMHFYIEHNKGHHKRVSTPEDPSSARYGENLYFFWVRSVLFAYLSAWHIGNDGAKKKGKSTFSYHNEMLVFQLIQITFLVIIFFFFGWQVTVCFTLAAINGFLLLETVNYIEHYGLVRKRKENGSYERVSPSHSWNSDHTIGRLLLFELSRHSDHHFLTSRKYQILRHLDNSPQMPTGYPGMMLLSTFPPLWFMVVHKSMKRQSLL